MFERTLQDLIRGLRAHKASSKAQEDAFLADAMVEIRDELKGKDMALKAEGIIKTCYVSVRLLERNVGRGILRTGNDRVRLKRRHVAEVQNLVPDKLRSLSVRRWSALLTV